MFFLRLKGGVNMATALELITELTQNEKVFIHIHKKPSTGYHNHEFLELTYVVDGCAEHIVEGEVSKLSKGDYFIIDYDKSHKYTQIGATPFVVINCLFTPPLIDNSLKGCRRLSDVVNNYLIKFDFCFLKDHPSKFIYHDDTGKIKHLFELLCSEYSEKKLGYLESMRSYIIAIIIDMLRQIKLPSLSKGKNDIIKHIIEYVDNNFSQQLSLKNIASDYNYSLSRVSQIFKQEIGMTFQKYIQTVRIHESCRLLLNTTKKISEIAELVGYTNIDHFHAIFKQEMNTTPRQFRSTHLSPKNNKST